MPAAVQDHPVAAVLTVLKSIAPFAHLALPEFHPPPKSYLLTVYVASLGFVAILLEIDHEENDAVGAPIASFDFGTFSIVA